MPDQERFLNPTPIETERGSGDLVFDFLKSIVERRRPDNITITDDDIINLRDRIIRNLLNDENFKALIEATVADAHKDVDITDESLPAPTEQVEQTDPLVNYVSEAIQRKYSHTASADTVNMVIKKLITDSRFRGYLNRSVQNLILDFIRNKHRDESNKSNWLVFQTAVTERQNKHQELQRAAWQQFEGIRKYLIASLSMKNPEQIIQLVFLRKIAMADRATIRQELGLDETTSDDLMDQRVTRGVRFILRYLDDHNLTESPLAIYLRGIAQIVQQAKAEIISDNPSARFSVRKEVKKELGISDRLRDPKKP